MKVGFGATILINGYKFSSGSSMASIPYVQDKKEAPAKQVLLFCPLIGKLFDRYRSSKQQISGHRNIFSQIQLEHGPGNSSFNILLPAVNGQFVDGNYLRQGFIGLHPHIGYLRPYVFLGKSRFRIEPACHGNQGVSGSFEAHRTVQLVVNRSGTQSPFMRMARSTSACASSSSSRAVSFTRSSGHV